MLLNRVLDALQSSQHGRRLLGFFVIALAVLYWLTRRYARSARRPNHGRLGAEAGSGALAPTVALSPGFQRVPMQQKVSVVSNDSIFDSLELSSIDSLGNSPAAVASDPCSLRVLPSARVSVLELARTCDLYIITQCSSDAAEDAVRHALRQEGFIDAGLHPHKILFCESEIGRGAMARQLEAALHIDSSTTTLTALAPFVPALAAIRTPANSWAVERLSMAPHITVVDHLAQYFLVPSHAQSK